MNEPNNKNITKFQPDKITRPIQLLAVWFISLIAVDTAFLTTAKYIAIAWIQGLLVAAAILNVYLFVFCLYRMQTKFRKEIQEDSYYSKSLGKIQISRITIGQINRNLSETRVQTFGVLEKIQAEIAALTKIVVDSNQNIPQLSKPLKSIEQQVNETEAALDTEVQWWHYEIFLNDLLPNYQIIKSAFRKAGIHIYDEFGTDSSNPHKPAIFLIAFARGIDIKALQDITRRSITFGAEAIEIVSETDLDWEQGRIYLGSYGFEYHPVAELSAGLTHQLLSPSLTADDFYRLVKENSMAKKVVEFKRSSAYN